MFLAINLLGREPLRGNAAALPERGGEQRQPIFQPRTPARTHRRRRLWAGRRSRRRRRGEEEEQHEEREREDEAVGHGDGGERGKARFLGSWEVSSVGNLWRFGVPFLELGLDWTA
uniref:APRL7 n=1 Tax=Arundo donax TaxID=35708 RepID=A0A0A9HPN0_ARUDO